MEVLGHQIHSAVSGGHWKAMQVVRGCPPISHVFFADDLLLFGASTLPHARVMKEILGMFCHQSGQKVNPGKSKIWFSPNISNTVANAHQSHGGYDTYFLSRQLPWSSNSS